MTTKVFRCFLLFLIGVMAPLLSDNISVFGIGRLGLSFALCFEKAGHHVLGLDVNQSYIDKINQKTLDVPEPYINDMLRASENFYATTSLKEALEFSDIYSIVLSTTTGQEGYNFDALNALLKEINTHKIANKHIIIHSTVFPGYVRNVAEALLSDCTNVTINYNPPFIAQGEIIKGLVTPDMILVGQSSEETGDLIERLRLSICTNHAPVARMSVESAEITKLALNCFVTSKIAFANLVGDIADETPGADKFDILKAVGLDSRIGSKYLLPGYGFGGPCFVRDNRALADYADLIKIEPVTFRATDIANEQHAHYMAAQFLNQNLEEYVFEDVSYKQNCPVKILYKSQKLEVAKLIAEQGKKVTIVDSLDVIKEIQASYGALFHYVVIE